MPSPTTTKAKAKKHALEKLDDGLVHREDWMGSSRGMELWSKICTGEIAEGPPYRESQPVTCLLCLAQPANTKP